MNKVVIALLAISVSVSFLTGCGRSYNERKIGALVAEQKPVVSAALLAAPEGKTAIPKGAPLTSLFPLWGEDRDRLDACVMQSTTQAGVIRILSTPDTGE